MHERGVCAALLALVSIGMTTPAAGALSKECTAVLRYEYSNRGFAHVATGRLRHSAADPGMRAWFSRHFALEELNRVRYAEHAAAFGLDTAPGLWNRVRGYAVSIAMRIAPGPIIARLERNTARYIATLASLRGSCPPEHADFIEYVIAQEAAQAQSLLHAAKGDYAAAAQVLAEFVEAQPR